MQLYDDIQEGEDIITISTSVSFPTAPFCILHIEKDEIEVIIRAPGYKITDSKGILKPYKNKTNKGKELNYFLFSEEDVSYFSINSQDELDYATRLIAQAYILQKEVKLRCPTRFLFQIGAFPFFFKKLRRTYI